MPELDLEFVRAQFPAFSEPSLAGQAFFENAGGSYACGQVIDRLTRFYRQRKVQPYAPYAASRLGGAEMDEGRARLAELLGVEGDELLVGPSTSQNTYVLAQAFRQMLAPGDALVVTDQDHEANSGVWRRLAEGGVEVREWRVDPASGHLDPAGLAALLDGRVRLVAFPHCSNIVGETNDVAALVAMVHDAGAVACVDGVSHAPHGLPDVGALGADVYLFSSYKTYGPHQGVMVVRRSLAEALPNQGHWFNAGIAAKRLTPAGPDHAQVAALAGVADYVEALDRRHFPGEPAGLRQASARVRGLMRAHETRLLQPLLDWAAARNDVRLVGPADAGRRVPTVSMVCAQPGAAVAAALAPHGVMAGGGDFYAVRLLQALGIEPDHGVLRLSFVHYTSAAEVGQAIAGLDAVLDAPRD
ncbi:MAG: aminotransferase class V-fold PLP-dependent enzyme [Amaricoccus sp.]|uniref:aminotransferase class V-fold PLP-dependent enzyme n=1 Tax=Amaricoccus sp. TaxID=1872485 RepID=UPI0039E37761